MANRKRAIPQYGTVTLNGLDYYRTRVQDADGKLRALYARTPEELYDKELNALEQIDNDTFCRKSPTVAEYCEKCALPGFVDSKNEEKTERNAGYLVVSHSGGGMLRQGTRKGIRRTPANRGMRAHWVVKGLDISEDVCHGMCP